MGASCCVVACCMLRTSCYLQDVPDDESYKDFNDPDDDIDDLEDEDDLEDDYDDLADLDGEEQLEVRG